MVTFKEVNPILPVRDLEKSIRYSVDCLGFRLALRDRSGPDNYAGVRRDTVELHLQRHAENEMPQRATLMLRIIVDDPDVLYEEYKSKIVFGQHNPLRDTPWGTREFAFFEPDGTGLTFYRDL